MALPKIQDVHFFVEKNGETHEFELYSDLLQYIFEQDDLIQSVLFDYNSEPSNKYTESVEDFLFRHLEDYLAENNYKFTKRAV